MKTDTAIAVMARSPGGDIASIKTRLASVLPAPADRRELYRAFLTDVIATVRGLSEIALRVAFTPTGSEAEFADLGVKVDELVPQRGDDLGSRERNLFEDLFRAGFRRVILIGSDLPTLPPSALIEAYRSLEPPDSRCVALGPSRDGGYYLIGLGPAAAGGIPDLFTHVRWSTPYAFEDTVRAAQTAGWVIARAPEWYDVDDREGLLRLRRDLEDPSCAARACATAATLARLTVSQ